MKPRELKREALANFSGKFVKLISIQFMYLLTVFAIGLLLGFLVNTPYFSSLSVLFSLAYLLLVFPLSFGILSVTIRMARKEDIALTEFINVSLKKFVSYWKVMFRIFLKILIPLIIFSFIAILITAFLLSSTSSAGRLTKTIYVLSSLITIMSMVLIIYLVLPYALSLFILHDNPTKSSKEILEMSSNMMKNNKLNYIKLLLSFIGWYLLFGVISYISKEFLPEIVSIFVNFIPTLLLVPYITITQFSFYENLNNQVVTNNSSNNETSEEQN